MKKHLERGQILSVTWMNPAGLLTRIRAAWSFDFREGKCWWCHRWIYDNCWRVCATTAVNDPHCFVSAFAVRDCRIETKYFCVECAPTADIAVRLTYVIPPPGCRIPGHVALATQKFWSL